jgi:hypothetical protein
MCLRPIGSDTARSVVAVLVLRGLLQEHEGQQSQQSYSLAEEPPEQVRRTATCGWPEIADKFGARGGNTPMIANRYQKKRTRRS